MSDPAFPIATLLNIDPAVASLIALLVAMAVSLTSRINVGLLAIDADWLFLLAG